MNKINYRIETDSFGEIKVNNDKYWGAQTQRSIINFPIGWEKQPKAIIRALGIIKKACAQVNRDNQKLDTKIADAIIQATQGEQEQEYSVCVCCGFLH